MNVIFLTLDMNMNEIFHDFYDFIYVSLFQSTSQN